MLWRRDSTVAGNWTPAVTRWVGTTAQMNSFAASAPNGFAWYDTTTNSDYVKVGGSWVGDTAWATVTTGVRWRRKGGAIFLNFSTSTPIPSGAAPVIGTLPVEARPPFETAITAFAPGIYAMFGRVTTSGVIDVRNTNTSSASGAYGSGSWPVA